MKSIIKQTKNITLLLIILTSIKFLSIACAEDATLKQQEVQITGKITDIYIEGPWEVVITQDSMNNSVVLEYDVPEKKIKTEYFDSGILRIKVYSMDNYEGKILRIKIAATALSELEARDGAKIQTNGKFCSSNINLSGASQLNGFWCEGAHAKLVLSEASEINNFTFSGGYNFDAYITDFSKVHVLINDVQYCKIKALRTSEFHASGSVINSYFFGIEGSVFKTFDLESTFLDVDFSGGIYAESTANTITGKLAWGSKLHYKKATDVSGIHIDENSELIQAD